MAYGGLEDRTPESPQRNKYRWNDSGLVKTEKFLPKKSVLLKQLQKPFFLKQ